MYMAYLKERLKSTNYDNRLAELPCFLISGDLLSI
jgi:hypothetical protein